MPQLLSFTVGAVALPLASICAPWGLVGQFRSALEFMSPGVVVVLLVAPESIVLGEAGVLGSTVTDLPLPLDPSAPAALLLCAMADVAKAMVKAEAVRIFMNMVCLHLCKLVAWIGARFRRNDEPPISLV
ncbi:hypothetical protein [Mesorhizobium sp. BH1-1-4]|uniref:hypothetical protein n=1 Tax=Mesorhizobium sp. BH1-1-4 TaxID=2876662 RepID=UPI001CD0F41B|nr:hypothetical protein [Mesorhizobium sp. BH1-1-4]MBZ9994385.1 hypothetical protein [Mesorhizobium sp. BH1-1-4]